MYLLHTHAPYNILVCYIKIWPESSKNMRVVWVSCDAVFWAVAATTNRLWYISGPEVSEKSAPYLNPIYSKLWNYLMLLADPGTSGGGYDYILLRCSEILINKQQLTGFFSFAHTLYYGAGKRTTENMFCHPLSVFFSFHFYNFFFN